MLDNALNEIAKEGFTLVDTMEQVSQVIDAASELWPKTTEKYGWDCVPHYDDKQKRWRFQVKGLSPFGIPEEDE